jgi:hypothetical protein
MLLTDDQRRFAGVYGPIKDRRGSPSPVPLVISVLAGLLAALFTLPADTEPAGALRLPAAMLATGLMGGITIRAIRLGFEEALHPECVITGGVVYFVLLDLIQGMYRVDVGRDAVRSVFIAVALFACVMFAATAWPPRPLPRIVVRTALWDPPTRLLVRALWLCFALGMFYFAFMSEFSVNVMLRGLLAGRFSAPWSRGDMGTWYAFIEHLAYFGYLLPTLTTIILLRERRLLSAPVLQGIVLSAVFLLFVMQGGGRRILGMCFCSALFTWLVSKRRTIKPRHIVTGMVLVGALLLIMDAMLVNRGSGAIEFSYSADEFRYVRVDDNFLRFAQNMEIVPRFQPHTGFDWLIWVLARPIPRALWPGKPTSPGFDLSSYLGITASLSCSSIAEWYVAFGWIGVVVAGVLYGTLCRFWGQALEHTRTYAGLGMYGLGTLALFISVRSMIELILMSYPLLAWLIICNYFVKRQSKR